MKRLMTAITAAAICLTLMCGCGENESSQGKPAEETTVTAAEKEPEVSVKEVDKGTMNGLTAAELTAQMKTGWNLGNALDSLGGSETSWGNPVTTQTMIDMINDGGFDILRVPVTWGEHMGGAPDFTVYPEFMDRVNEVVDYGIGDGMYVILEIHHEPDLWLLPDSEHMAEVEPQFKALWEQIADRFKDYGDHLIFESMNEPRVKGKTHEWTGGNKDERGCVNQLNKDFVEIVRASGGNNSERMLLIATHAQAVTKNALEGLELIDDKNVGVAVHTYIPYSFCYHSGESYETFEWDGHENGAVDSVFALLDKYFLSKGVPVMITEYGAEFKLVGEDSYEFNSAEVVKWAEYFLGKAKEYGIPCVIWDNNEHIPGTTPFGIFNRDDLSWNFDDVRQAIMKVYEEEQQ